MTFFGFTVPLAWLKFQLLPFIFALHGVSIVTVSTAPGGSSLVEHALAAARRWRLPLSYQVSAIVSRAIGAVDMFFTLIGRDDDVAVPFA